MSWHRDREALLTQLRALRGKVDNSTIASYEQRLALINLTIAKVRHLATKANVGRAEVDAVVSELGRHRSDLERMNGLLWLKAGTARPRPGSTVSNLGDIIRETESASEAERQRRQTAHSTSPSLEQKANQLYDLLSRLMKALHQMQMGTVRNML